MGSIEEVPLNTSPTSPAMHQLITVETDLLIVGAGPAGASLACFLARYNLTGIMISSAPGTADTPRAHVNNMAALETLRDIGLYDDCLKVGHGGEKIMHYRWCETMAGEEYARNYSWGNGGRKGDYDTVSPCTHLDLPQSLLEPIMVKYASHNGFKVRFHTELLSFSSYGEGEEERTTCLVRDSITNSQYRIKTRFLFGADGGRSLVTRELGLPMTVMAPGGLAFNVLVRAELGHLMRNRLGNLHWCVRMRQDHPFMCVGRMVKPWHEWMFVFFPKGPDAASAATDRSHEDWIALVKDFIGDESVEVEMIGVSKWMINETSADIISKGNTFCLGDAIHRHPPTLGLGSNTGIQDSFNLSWKIALVLRNLAPASLLSTYNTERQPVGASLVKASNDVLRKHIRVWQALGCMPYGTPSSDLLNGMKTLKSATEEGKVAREHLKEMIDEMQNETHALGVEMGQLYQSPAIYLLDETSPFQPIGKEAVHPGQFYEPSTYPGRRLPHVWLGTRIPGPLVSTLDVAGKGRFTLFTGIGGEGWVTAASRFTKKLGVDVKVVRIGQGLEWEDTYFKWEEKRGIHEDGCVLVRPDFFVAWRAQRSGTEDDCEERLWTVLKSILGIEG